MTSSDFAILRRLIDGGGGHVTADEAKALHALCWEARSEVARERRAREAADERAAELDRENANLVAQVLDEDRRAAVMNLALSTAVEYLRTMQDGDARRYNPRGLKATVADFLSTLKVK